MSLQSRREFIATVRERNRATLRAAAPWLVLIGVAIGVLIFATPRKDRQRVGFQRTNQVAEPPRIVFWGAIGGLFAAAIGAAISASRVEQSYSCRCPRCGKDLSQDRAGIVIASGRCIHCGATVLRDATSDADRLRNHPPLSVFDVVRGTAKLARSGRRAIWVMALSILVFHLSIGVSAVRAANYASSLSPSTPYVVLVIALVPYIAGLALLFAARRANLVRCPCCDKTLEPPQRAIAIASGCCGYCGERIIDDYDHASAHNRDSRLSSRPTLLTRTKFTAGQRRVKRRGIAVAAAAFAPLLLTPAAIGISTQFVNMDDAESIRLHVVNSALLVAIGIAFALFALRWSMRWSDVAPRCRDCNGTLGGIFQQIALATSHCGHCGGRVIRADDTESRPAKSSK